MSYSTSVAGAFAVQKSISLVSDNISNASTTAFKSSNISFSDVMGTMPFDIQRATTGNGVQATDVKKEFSNGSIALTGSATDLAISGSAFFVTAPKDDGRIYDTPMYNNYFTRNGSFNIDLDGYLVTAENYHVLDTDYRPIQLPTTTFSNIEANFESSGNLPNDLVSDTFINQATINFAVDDPEMSLNWTDDLDQKFVQGDVFLKDNGVFYIPSVDAPENQAAIKIGEIDLKAPNNLEIRFDDPVIQSPVTTLQLVEVEKTFDVEVDELVTKQITTSQLVQVDKIEVSKQKVYLDTFSTKVADFNSDDWSIVNDRFYVEDTLVNGFPSPPDTQYGNPESPKYSEYERSNQFERDNGLNDRQSFQVSVSPDGQKIDLTTGVVKGQRGYETTRGPFVHSNDPVFLKGGTSVSFDWHTEGSRDAYDVFVYLRNTETGEYSIAVNETGIGDINGDSKVSADEDTPQSGTYSFTAPADGEFDVVIVGGTWDGSGGSVASATSSISNFTYEGRDFEEQDVETVVKVWEARNVTTDVQVWETVTKQKTEIVTELQEVTVFEDMQIDLHPALLGQIGSQISAKKSGEIKGREINPVSLDVTLTTAENVEVNSKLSMNNDSVTYLGEKTVLNQFDSLNIDTSGNISVSSKVNDLLQTVKLGTLAFTNPVSMDDLTYLRSGYFAYTDTIKTSEIGSISEVAGGTVSQGALERSNVDIMEQLTQLISNQMMFSANSKAIEAYTNADKMLREIR